MPGIKVKTPEEALEKLLWGYKETETGCWEWEGCLTGQGYGIMHYAGKYWPTHRLHWFLMSPWTDPSLSILHRCNNRKCIRLGHLYAGTQKDNIKDQYEAGTNINQNRKLLPEEAVKEIQGAKVIYGQRVLPQLAEKWGISLGYLYVIRSGRSIYGHSI